VAALAVASIAAPAAAQEPGSQRERDLAGRRAFERDCGGCHSLDLPRSQRLDRDIWLEVVDDMIKKYGATWITPENRGVIADYAARYFGPKPPPGPEPELPADVALQSMPQEVGRLMQANACLGCHALDRKVVGPAFGAVADRYRGDAAAAEKLFKKLRAGGSGVWGETAMPPNAVLSDRELKQVIDWVLGVR
jgi:cytochrome c